MMWIRYLDDDEDIDLFHEGETLIEENKTPSRRKLGDEEDLESLFEQEDFKLVTIVYLLPICLFIYPFIHVSVCDSATLNAQSANNKRQLTFREYFVNVSSGMSQWTRPYQKQTFYSHDIEIDAFVMKMLYHDVLFNRLALL